MAVNVQETYSIINIWKEVGAASNVLKERKLLFKKAYQEQYATIKRNFRKRYRENDYGAVEFDDRFDEFKTFLKGL